MNITTNPPAFPFVAEDESGMMINMGITMRDYFAAKAMHCLLPQYREMFMDGTLDDWISDAIPELAKEAYYLADEMMKARGK